MAIRIILADDHILLRSGLKLLLETEPEIEVVGEASDGYQAIQAVEETKADMLVLDLSMPVMDGLECIREIRSRGMPIKIIVLTMHEDENYVKEVMRAGAQGYVQKAAVDTELFAAIEAVRQGKLYLSQSSTQTLLTILLSGKDETDAFADNPYTVLSPREREVLKYLVRGYSVSEIAATLALSIKTIDTYKTRIMDKLGFTKKSEMVQYALKHGLLA